jgi:hypothetical protein
MRAIDVQCAFAVVQLTFPGLKLSQWLKFACAAARLPAKKGGLMAMCDARNYIHALFFYRVERDLEFKLALKVSHLIVARLPGQALDTALIDSLDNLARQNDCQAICLELMSGGRSGETGRGLRLSDAISVLRPFATCLGAFAAKGTHATFRSHTSDAKRRHWLKSHRT